MEQIERIQHMEGILDELTALTKTLSEALPKYKALRPKIKELSRYYKSDEWKRDLADDEAGKLPVDLKRGVLSEDGIFNALDEERYLLPLLIDTIQNAL